jgi:polysaccharide export outer membrane protein
MKTAMQEGWRDRDFERADNPSGLNYRPKSRKNKSCALRQAEYRQRLTRASRRLRDVYRVSRCEERRMAARQSPFIDAARAMQASFALLLLIGCAQPPPAAPARASASAAPVAAPDYVIGPGDSLNVFVYRSPELSANGLPVRPDGKLSLPLIPDIEAAGRTPTQLAREVERRLKEYVREPNVTVMVQSFIGQPSRQIRVIGEATQPMAMPYREGMTVLDVLIATRGLTRYAAGNRAEIIRREREEDTPQAIRVRLSDLLRDGDITQDVAMRPGDTLVIPQSWF